MNQQRDLDRTHNTRTTPVQDDDIAPGRGSLSSHLTAPEHPLTSGLVQRKGNGAGDRESVHRAASHDTSGPSTSLPHLDQMQRSFGPDHETADIVLSAIYEEVPGDAKDKVRRAKESEAVWLDPLHFLSDFPQEKKATRHVGVVAGGGRKVVDTFAAPISNGVSPTGRGSITAQLKYAGNTSKSLDVTVSGTKHPKDSKAKALEIIHREISLLGDVEDLTALVEAELNQDPKFKGAKVSIKADTDKTQQQGSTSFNYRVRSNAGIRMDFLAQPVGGKTVTAGGSKTVDEGVEDEATKRAWEQKESEQIRKTEDDKYKKNDQSTETHDVDYYEKVSNTLDDYVNKTTKNHTELAKELAKTVTNEKEAHYTDHELTANKKSNWTDWTKDSKHTVKSGERDKENWAAKLRKGIDVVQTGTDIPDIPYIGKTKVGKWFGRKLKGWGIALDIIDAGLGWFEAKGKVTFTDTNLDETGKSKGGSTDDTERNRKVDLKEDDEEKVNAKLTEDYESATEYVWNRHLKDIKEISKTYRSKIKKDSQTTVDKNHQEDYKRDDIKTDNSDETKHKARKSQTTISTFSTTYGWKFTRPKVQSTVVSGDAEVSDQPFGPEPGEAARGSTTK